MHKIAFLYLDQSYMVYHSISIAIEMATLPSSEIYIFTNPQNKALILEILSKYKCQNVRVSVLTPYWSFTVSIAKAEQKQLIYWRYKKELSKIDVFICCKYTDLSLKNILKNKAKYVYTEHGIPNRIAAFSDKTTKFDLFFLSGVKQKKIKERDKHLTPTNHVLTGYFKLELVENYQNKNVFNNTNYTFLYNPHWEKHLTSFPRFGYQVFQFFTNNPQYNLIFSPHLQLVKNDFILKYKIKKYVNYPNILIDLGSEACNDMTYTKLADFYIGEGSSQIWEFVAYRSRPCLFLDAHNLRKNEEERLLSWKLGDIISNLNNFETSIQRAKDNFRDKYKAIQVEEVSKMFYEDSQFMPSRLAAQAIIKLLEK